MTLVWPQLTLQKADMAVASMTITGLRDKYVDFTTPFLDFGTTFVMKVSCGYRLYSLALFSSTLKNSAFRSTEGRRTLDVKFLHFLRIL